MVEGAIFVSNASSPTGLSGKGSLRLSRITDPAIAWLVGDCQNNANDPKKDWCAVRRRPTEWKSGHGPAFRHGEKANVCMVDGHVESLTRNEIEKRKLTEDVLGNERAGGNASDSSRLPVTAEKSQLDTDP